MSYDVSYIAKSQYKEGRIEVYWRNHTSNMAPLWRDLGCDIAEFDGKTCREFTQALAPAVEKLRANLDGYRKYDAPNGWGSAATTLEFLDGLLVHADIHPDAIVEVSR